MPVHNLCSGPRICVGGIQLGKNKLTNRIGKVASTWSLIQEKFIYRSVCLFMNLLALDRFFQKFTSGHE